MFDLETEIKALPGPIVIFGAGGFIGANLLRTILRFRKDVYGITHQKIVPWRINDLSTENILYGDINLPDTLRGLFDKYFFKTVFNFAAYGGYSKQNDPDLIYRTNFLGVVNLLEIAANFKVSAFVQAGSSSEYGLNSAAPTEGAELLPNSHYAVSKIGTGALIKFYGKVKGLPSLNLRLYSAYGPYEEMDRLVPTLLREGMRGKFPPLVNPDISRDFVCIDDITEAVVIAAAQGVRKASGASLNIATGKKTTIREIVQLVRAIFEIKSEPEWKSMQDRAWDLKDWVGNPSLAKELLGWEAKIPLREGLLKTVEWMKSYKEVHSFIKPSKVPKLSAVAACYLDGQAIPVMYDRLSKVFNSLVVNYEIIFVNDGSPDNSREVLAQLAEKDKHVIVIEHSRNFGSQSSFLSGMQVASGDAVILLDGDLQDPPEIIPDFYKRWTEGYEVVYGRRVKRQATAVLNFCYKAFYRLFRGMAYIPLPLDAGDFSLMDRKVVDQLIALPETDQFLRGLRAWVGFKQTGVDYVRPERMFGVTTNNWRKNIWWAKKAIFSFSFIPLEILGYLGVFLTFVSFLALVGQIISKLLFPDIPHGISIIIVLVLFFGAVQVLAISVIGEYLMRIFEETKKRPKFIRKAVHLGSTYLTSGEEIELFIKKRKNA